MIIPVSILIVSWMMLWHILNSVADVNGLGDLKDLSRAGIVAALVFSISAVGSVLAIVWNLLT